MSLRLELHHLTGWNPKVEGGLFAHPDGQNYVYSLGSNVVISNLMNPTQQEFLQGHKGCISCLAVSPGGDLIASGENGASADVVVWDYGTKQEVYRIREHGFGLQSLSFSNDGRFLATLGNSRDRKMYVWDMQTGNIVAKATATATLLRFGGRVTDSSGRATTSYRLVGSSDRRLVMWVFEPSQGTLTSSMMREGKHMREYTSFAWSPNFETLYCGSSSGDVTEVSAYCGKIEGTTPVKCGKIDSLDCREVNGVKTLFVGGSSGAITVLEWDGKQWIDTKQSVLPSSVSSISFHTNGGSFLAGCQNGHVFTVASVSLKYAPLTDSHVGPVIAVAHIPNSTNFATASLDGSVKVWTPKFISQASMSSTSTPLCLAVAPSTTGAIVISGWKDGFLRAMRASDGAIQWTIPDAHDGGVRCIQVSLNGAFCVTGGEKGEVRVWDLNSRIMVSHLKEHYAAVQDVAIFGDDLHATSVSKDKTMLCWDLQTEKRIAAHTQRMGGINSVTLSADQSKLLTAGQEKKISTWDLRETTAVHTMNTPNHAEFHDLRVSNNGAILAGGGTDGVLSVYDAESKTLLAQLPHMGSGILGISFSLDDRQVVVVGQHGNIHVWDIC